MQRRSTLARLGLLAAVSALAGLLVAGMLLPLVGGVGLAARTGANDFESLPAELSEPPLPQVSRILAADGSTLATFFYENRVTVPLSSVPAVMQKALIAVEDVRFYEHHGVDVKGALRALVHNGSSGSVQQGGSTLTQQYVKNVLIETAQDSGDAAKAKQAHADTLGRKAREARYALALEQKLSKDEILERYLNIAYFGDGAYGVGTASLHYFGKPVNRLTLPEAAMLAGVVQAPGAYDPNEHPKAARARRDVVLAQMLKYHFIEQPAYDTAVATRVVLHVQRAGNGCETSSAPYFCDYVLNVVKRSTAFGATEDDRIKLLLRGGLTITTTLDPKVQRAAQSAVLAHVHPHEPYGVAGAEAVVEPGTGAIKAIAVSTPFGNDHAHGQNTVNYATDNAYGGSSGFSAGSTFKVFVLAAAIKEGIPLRTRIASPQTAYNLTGYTRCDGGEAAPYQKVSNAGDSEQGTFNLFSGTWFSVNTFYAKLEQRTGLCEPTKLAEAMGIRAASSGKPPSQYASFVLGAADTYSPLDVATAYATLAAHGKHCDPIAITKVVDRSGHVLPTTAPQCDQVLDPGIADTVTSVLQGVLTKRGATGYGLALPDDRPAAAKTGTAEDYQSAFFAGYTPQLAAAAVVARPKAPVKYPLRKLTIGGQYFVHVFGADVPGPIWHDTMAAALSGTPVEQFAPADPRYVAGITKPVPDVSGYTVDDARATLEAAGFQVRISPYQIDSELPAGTVAATNPYAGSAAPPSSTVTVFLSNGVPPPAPPVPTPTPAVTVTALPSSSASAKPPTQSPAPNPSPSCRPPNKHCH